jgi:hypothetical protein
MTILITTLWWISGVCSFIYWWIKDFDFEKSTALLAAYVGLIGPIAFIVGWFLYKPKDGISDVWIKRRNK